MNSLLAEARRSLLRGIDYERRANELCQEAEQAFADAGSLKAEGRARVAGEAVRMLPIHERAADVRTNSFKAMQDAKADHAYYTTQASMYAALAAMEFAKSQALMARHALGLEGMPGNG